MQKILSLSALLTMLVGVAIAISISFGHGQGRSERLGSSHVGDCALPCFADLTIGQTQTDEASRQIDQTFGARGLVFKRWLYVKNSTYESWTNGDASSGLNATFEEGVLTSIGLWTPFEAQMPTLAELVSTWGAPSCAFTDDHLATFRAFYDDQKYVVWITAEPVNGQLLNAPVRQISVEFSTRGTCQGTSSQPWQGFASMRRYVP